MRRVQAPKLATMTAQRRMPNIPMGFPLFFLCFCMLLSVGGIKAHADGERHEAQISIMSDVADPTVADEMTIRILDNRSQDVLAAILRDLSAKLRVQPQGIKFTSGDPDFPTDKSAAVTCNMPIVPRGADYLPLAPFIETFAPYATRLRIVYDVKGTFVYHGYTDRYTDSNIEFTVDAPPAVRLNEHEAFYSYDITIKKSSLPNLDLPNHPGEGKATGAWKYARVILAIGAAIIIIALGLFVALLLPRRKEQLSSKKESSDENGR